jgi:hypothetical protein
MRIFDKDNVFIRHLQKDAFFDLLYNSIGQKLPVLCKNGSNFATAKDNVSQNDNLTK